jgi:hypothetical protein
MNRTMKIDRMISDIENLHGLDAGLVSDQVKRAHDEIGKREEDAADGCIGHQHECTEKEEPEGHRLCFRVAGQGPGGGSS